MKQKGQMIFEFIIAAVLFFVIVFYVLSYLDAGICSSSQESQNNLLESKAIQISELLVHKELTEKWPVLDTQKINNFNGSCSSNYTKVREKFNLIDNHLHFFLHISTNNNVVASCGKEMPNNVAVVKRFALSDQGEVLTLIIKVSK